MHPPSTLLVLILLVILVSSSVSSSSSTCDNNNNEETIPDPEPTAIRPSPSEFAFYKERNKDQNRAASSLGFWEDNIKRTSGANCHQWPGSTYTCDMCCDGNCCEDPQFWKTNHSLENAQIWIPIRVVYVIGSSGDRNALPSDDKVKQLFSKVNTAFARFPFRFLFNVSEVIQDDAIHGHCSTDPCFTNANCGFLTTLIPAMKFKTDKEIVVTVCDGIKYLGESQFPWGAPQFQYVELQLKTFADQFPYIVHELAHYTGLMHVFEGACGSRGDWVEDTTASSRPSSSCYRTKDSCPTINGKDDITNFMNYGLFWECGLHFTEGQRLRSIQAMEFYRPSLIANTRVKLNESNARPGVTTVSESNPTTTTAPARIPACSVDASTFEDCWCEYPELDPRTWCKEVAADGKTFNTGVTLSPPTPTPETGFLGIQKSTVMSSTIIMMLFLIGASIVSVYLFVDREAKKVAAAEAQEEEQNRNRARRSRTSVAAASTDMEDREMS